MQRLNLSRVAPLPTSSSLADLLAEYHLSESERGPTHPLTIRGITLIAQHIHNIDLRASLLWYRFALRRTDEAQMDSSTAIEQLTNVLDILGDHDGTLPLFWYCLAERYEQNSTQGGSHFVPLGQNPEPDNSHFIRVGQAGIELCSQKQYSEALPLLMRAGAGIGEDYKNPIVPELLYSVWQCHSGLGNSTEAMDYACHHIAVPEEGLSLRDQFERVEAMEFVAEAWCRDREYEQSLGMYTLSLSVLEGMEGFGKAHPATVDTVLLIARVLRLMGRYEEAVVWYGRVRETEGLSDELFLRGVAGMAEVLCRMGNLESALDMRRECLRGWATMFGEWSTKAVTEKLEVAGLLVELERYAEADKLCITIMEKDGIEVVASLKVYEVVGKIRVGQRKYAEALEYHQRALRGFKQQNEKDGRLTSLLEFRIGQVYTLQGMHHEALPYYEHALTTRDTELGRTHKETLDTLRVVAECYSELAAVHQSTDRLRKAIGFNGKALAARERLLPKQHPEILTNVHSMAVLFGKVGRWKAAEEFYQRAWKGREVELGKGHEDTIESWRGLEESRKMLNA